ncbi:helix-turn-helix transcriptional regulator [Halalkalibacter urbisdiaboli]|uniref:helix-turn-helix transcriptional regulator n=1 Tax=Halalkalibacter urbisdiaboli TaxID=1960589 RepID=UPI001FD90867|nr:AraC family transcriptional regulator [Halalkalibacter urbisdiaboli]
MSIPSIISGKLSLAYRMDQRLEMNVHSHEEYEIYYFHKGKCTYLIGDQIHVLSPGDLILMHGLTLHCPKIVDDADYIRTTLHFDHVHYRGTLQKIGMEFLLEPFVLLKSFLIPFRGDLKEEMEHLFARMNDFNGKKDAASQARFELAFIDILAHLYPFCQQNLSFTKEPQSEKEKHVHRIIAFIDQHYNEDITLERLENILHLNKYYLSKVFKDVTGVTIFTYLYHRRINQAKVEFMMEEEVTVTDVSARVGFKHLSHFSKMFKAITGVTPEHYKKLHRPY